MQPEPEAGKGGGGGGARAAARFAAGKQLGLDGEGPGRAPLGAPVRRSGWVQDAEGAAGGRWGLCCTACSLAWLDS